MSHDIRMPTIYVARFRRPSGGEHAERIDHEVGIGEENAHEAAQDRARDKGWRLMEVVEERVPLGAL